jgi:RNA polymerase sigma-70 factor (sigma-E family)
MRSARGEEFEQYVFARRAELLRTATLLTAGDRHLAEDLVQSTLTRLYVAWPAFQRARNPGGYARRALVNALVDERRRPWRREEALQADLPELPVSEPADAGDEGERLNQALRGLPPRMRATLVFRYFHDLSVADTAEALGCTEGTVKSATARALDRLREVLELRAVDLSPSPTPRSTITPQADSATTFTRSY